MPPCPRSICCPEVVKEPPLLPCLSSPSHLLPPLPPLPETLDRAVARRGPRRAPLRFRPFRSKPMPPSSPPSRAAPPRRRNLPEVTAINLAGPFPSASVPPPPSTPASPFVFPCLRRPLQPTQGELRSPLDFLPHPLSLSCIIAPCATAAAVIVAQKSGRPKSPGLFRIDSGSTGNFRTFSGNFRNPNRNFLRSPRIWLGMSPDYSGPSGIFRTSFRNL